MYNLYEYIIGDIVEVFEDRIVLESNNIGYALYTSSNTIQNINERENVKMRTHLSVREDDMTLYGFLTLEELEMFRLLQTVSKIGPKVAIGVLSALTAGEIKRAILFDDEKTLTKAPGIGKKTAQRMILELKDRVKAEDILPDEGSAETVISGPPEGSIDEAVEALVSLGYGRNEVYAVMAKFETDGKTVEEIIKFALVNMGR